MRVQVRYNTHLPALSLRGGDNWRTLLTGMVLPTLHDHVICKNWHLCGVCSEYYGSKKLHVPTSRRW